MSCLHSAIGRDVQTGVVKSFHKNVRYNKHILCSTIQPDFLMYQELSLDDFSSDTKEELLNKLIKATDTNQFWINTFV